MAKKYISGIIAFFVVISLSIISGCIGGIGNLNPLTKASLKININPPLSMQTVVPDNSYVYSYVITGNGPDGATFTKTLTNVGGNYESTAVTLSLGQWTVNVDAKNNSGVILGHGSSTVDLQAGGSSVDVAVNSIEGKGTFQINLSWPSGIIADPKITGIITDNNNLNTPITCTVGSNNVSASYSNTSLDAGYYILTLNINDGPTLLRTIVEAVWIVVGQTTTWTISLTTSDISNTIADLTINIDPDLKEPYSVEIFNFASVLPLGDSMDLIASVSNYSNNVFDSFAWYVDGKVLPGPASDHATVGSNLSVGKHTVTLIVKKGAVYSSCTYSFIVSSNITTLFSDDGESSSGITPSGTWTKTTADYHSPTHSWATTPNDAPYSPDADMSLTLPQIDVPAGKTAVLSFWHKYDTDQCYGGDWNDNCVVEISNDGGNSWGYWDSGCFYGSSSGWEHVHMSLYTYSNDYILRFHFRGNGYNYDNHKGWSIDDIKVYY